MRDLDDIHPEGFIGEKHLSICGEWELYAGFYFEGFQAVLLRFCGNSILSKRLDFKVERASVSQNGFFALSSYSIEECITTLYAFDRYGIKLSTVASERFVLSFAVVDEGEGTIFSDGETVYRMQRGSEEVIEFCSLPYDFYPAQATFHQHQVHLKDANDEWWPIVAGIGLNEYATWLTSHLERSSGTRVYMAIRHLAESMADWSPDECLASAQWLDVAISRDIEVSFHIKISDVYRLQAKLLRSAGREVDAEKSSELADESLDGFRVTDELKANYRNLLKGGIKEQLLEQIARLNKAEEYPRLKDSTNYHSRLLRIRGELNVAAGNIDEARSDFETAIALNPRIGCKRMLENLEESTQ